ncbi:MAG TPA: ABC transporter permease subunit [Methyloceanibacter sp.]|jgi:phosphate transport system permease protein|nr:ABC transporter permease subunit [Methyloceanibacter sp.]
MSAWVEPLRPSAIAADRLYVALGWLAGAIGFALPLGIVGFLVVEGIGRISWDFLLLPPMGYPLGSSGGIAPAIQGSLALVGLGLALALPLALASAIGLSEYVEPSGRMAKALRFAAESLAAVPAILYGLFGYTVFVVFCRFEVSLLSGALTLGLMMLPIILIGTHAALQAIEFELRESALALGVSRSYAMRRIFLPRALPGIVAVTVLAAGHAVGSAAPVMFTASVAYARGAPALDAPVMTLPTHLYYIVSEALDLEQAYGTALVLVIGLLCANAFAMLLRRWLIR